MREKENDDKNEDCRQRTGERCACAGLFIDEGLRGAAADGKAAAQSGDQIRRREREIFPISVEPPAMFSDKHSTDGRRLDRAKKKTGKGKGKQIIEVMPVNRRQFERRNSLRHGADQFQAARFQRKRRRRDDSSDDDDKRDGFVFEEDFSKNKQRQRDSSNEKRHRACLVQMLEEETGVPPKTSVRAVKSEKLRQLRAGQKKRDAGFESGHDTF